MSGHTVDDAAEVRMDASGPSMFGAPRWEPGGSYDVVFVGVPCDMGGLGYRSPASAPGFLRMTSNLFPMVNGDSGCVGWYDYSTGKTLLEGIRFADAGDLVLHREDGSAQLERLPAVYRTLRANCQQLVVLGGDHSISYYLSQVLGREAIIWLDAHEDAGQRLGPHPNCSNVVSYIEQLPHIPAIAHFGTRGIVPADRNPVSKHRTLCRSVKEVLQVLEESNIQAVALSMDVDVLDPSVLPAVGSAMPGGLAPGDLLDLVQEIALRGIDISVMELTEFAPISEHDVTSGLVLINYLLRAIDLSRSLRK